MKLLLGLCLVICFVGAHCEDIATLMKNAKSDNSHIFECVAESKVDMQLLEDIAKNHVFPNTPEIQCYIACLMKRGGMMNTDGTFTKEFLEAKDTQACKNEGGKGTCEIAFKAIGCLIKAHPIEGSPNFKF